MNLMTEYLWDIKFANQLLNNMNKIKTTTELKSKVWYGWLKRFYILCYIPFILGALTAFSASLEKFNQSIEPIPTQYWLWIIFMMVTFFLLLYLLHRLIKMGFYYLIFKTIKPEIGNTKKEGAMKNLYKN